jgi:hypothetical protein
VKEGDFNTYFYGNFGSVVFTVEVSDTTIQDPNMVDGIVARNLPAIYYLLQRALGGRITGVVRDSITQEPIEAEVRVLEHTNPDINPRMTRADFGRYDRILNPGTYTLGFLKSGYYPRQINNVMVSNSPIVHDINLLPMAPRPPAPSLQFPADGQRLMDNQFVMDWSDVGLASRYLLEISSDSLFGGMIISDSNIVASQFPLPSPLSNGGYFWRVKGGNNNGWGPYSAIFRFIVDAQSGVDDSLFRPESFALRQNYPNPFNARTTITFTLERDSKVSLYIFSLQGELVASLLSNCQDQAGEHRIFWDGRDKNGRAVSSGSYFFELVVNNERRFRTMSFLK